MGKGSKDATRGIQTIIKDLRSQGWQVDRRGKGYKAMPPVDPATGRRAAGPVFFHLTPGDRRYLDNLKALLRRHGANI